MRERDSEIAQHHSFDSQKYGLKNFRLRKKEHHTRENDEQIALRWRAQFITSDEKFIRSLCDNNFQNSWQDAVPFWHQTKEAIRNRDLACAEEAIRRLYTLFETECTRINMAAIHLEKHNPKSALNVLEYSGTLAKDYWEYYLNRALARMDLKDYQLALMELNNLTHLQESNVKVACYFAKVYQNLGYFYKAGEYLKLTAELAPTYSHGWYLLGMVQSKLGNLQEAYTSFDRAQKINPEHFGLWYNKGNVLLRLTKYEDALKCYRYCLRLNPGYALGWNNLGICFKCLGRLFEALQSFRKALSFNPRLHEAVLNCGLLF
ncbi:MAG: tetratricopeptide repeat protein, partial [Calditrichaeota bacterium]